MKPVTILKKVYRLFDDKKKWTFGSYAQDASGVDVAIRSPDAVCWCIEGAIIRYSPDDESRSGAIDAIERTLFGSAVEPFARTVNDSNDGYRKIRALLRRTIRRLGGEV